MSVIIKKISSKADLDNAHQVRTIVFVDEQKVPREEEIDQFEDDCIHFVALDEDVPVGACRWRFTKKGVKLERFAVLSSYRGKGVGSKLVEAVLDDIQSNPGFHGQSLYLHSQLDAIPLYKKYGFKKVGEMFEECDIKHYKMVKEPL